MSTLEPEPRPAYDPARLLAGVLAMLAEYGIMVEPNLAAAYACELVLDELGVNAYPLTPRPTIEQRRQQLKFEEITDGLDGLDDLDGLS